MSFDDSLWQQQLPTLTLLTLVENAIKHGINPSQKPGNIEIISHRLDNHHWQICVNNSLDGEYAVQGTNTGLANLQQRLHLLSPRHSLAYRKLPNRFEVCIKLVTDLKAELTNDQNSHR